MNVKSFIPKDLPAQNDGLLAVDPDADNAAILVVVVVAGCSYAGPHESAVGENWAESCQEERTWEKETGNDFEANKIPHCSNVCAVKTEHLLYGN